MVIQNPNEISLKPGEMGKPVILPKNISESIKKQVDDGWTRNAFNEYVSNSISLKRTLPDPRDEWLVALNFILTLF